MIEAAQRYRQTTQFLSLGGIIHENADLWLEIERRIRLMWARFKRFGPELHDGKTAPISLKLCMLKAEVFEALLYGLMCYVDSRCGTLRQARKVHQVLLQPAGHCGLHSRQRSDYATVSYAKALKKTRCESIETTICKRGGSSLRGLWHGKARGTIPRSGVFATMTGRELSLIHI